MSPHLLDSLDSSEDVMMSNGQLHLRILHLQRGMDALFSCSHTSFRTAFAIEGGTKSGMMSHLGTK